MKLEHLLFQDSVLSLPCPPRELPEAYGLSVSKSWYPHYFNTEKNLNYIGANTDVSYYGVNEMGEWESRVFVAWYDSQNPELFDNRHLLEKYCQDNFTVLKKLCRVFRTQIHANREHRILSRVNYIRVGFQ